MVRSMTAVGSFRQKSPYGYLTVSIQSLNRKGLEVSVRLPDALQGYDVLVRKQVQALIHRGRIDVAVAFDAAAHLPSKVVVNLNLAKHIKEALEKLSAALYLDPIISLDKIAQFEGVVVVGEESGPTEFPEFSHAVNEALNNLNDMKREEGVLLAKELLERIDAIQLTATKIHAASAHDVETHMETLKARLKELLRGTPFDEERMIREAALLADKEDISEEISRLLLHITAFKTCISNEQLPHGKKLEFITQEMLRETSTMGAKASKFEIISLAIDIKTELERIREQVQNIE